MSGIVAHQELEYYAQRYSIVIILLLCALVFITPLLLRIAAGAPITPGTESYGPLRQSELLLKGMVGSDTLHPEASHILPQMINPYTFLLAFIGLFSVPWLLPPLLACLFVVLLYFLLIRYYTQRSIITIAMMVLIVSPLMSLLSTWHTPVLLCAIFIVLACMYDSLSPLFIVFAALTHPVLGSIAGIVITSVLVWRGKRLLASISGTVLVAVLLLWVSYVPLQKILSPASMHIMFELGAAAGLSVFFVILGVYGLFVDFPGRRLMLISALIGAILLAIVFPSTMIVATIALALLAGHAIHFLLVAEWRLTMLQESLLILIACVAIFLIITTVRERIADEPDAELSHTLIALRNLEHPGAVLSAPEYAPVIEYYTNRPATLWPGMSPELLLLRDAETVYARLLKSDTSYIIITQQMRDNLFLNSEQGMLFLLEHSGRFVQVTSSDTNVVWYFIPMQ